MLIILLPAYNESQGISQLLVRINQAFHDFAYHIVVVNDGSSDETGTLVQEAADNGPVTLLTHSVNQGLGRAMHTGIEYVCNTWSGDDILVTMDADNTHDPELIHEMYKELKKAADIVIASRFIGCATQIGVPLYRKVLSTGARIIFQLIFPVGANDYTSGYRMYRVSLLQKAMKCYQPFIEANGFVVMVEILLKLSKLKPEISEVPLILRYDLKESASKLRLVRTLIEYVKVLLRVRLRNPIIP
ncbi:MAG: glycosyltransferase [Gemmatimonadota bacterium]|nr:glycosyltransferase [Gemmatimonadota bacterium]